jgi:signal transduction histidine kinase/CheY-like chemotaxis protein
VPQARIPKMTTGISSALDGGGAAGEVLRATDWSKTSIGPVASWPNSLRLTVGMLLHSRHPMFLWWGPELIQFYNDAYIPSFGRGKHPAAMGQRGRDCWGEVWPIIGPQIDDVMKRGIPSWHQDALVPIFRNGRIEEVYWTYGYSPVFDDDGSIGGTLVVCTETTNRVVAQRRLTTVGAVAEATAGEQDLAAIVVAAIGALGGASLDLPFVLACEAALPDAEPRILRAVGLANPRVEADVAALAAVAAGGAPPGDILVVSLAGIALESLAPWAARPSEAFVARLGGNVLVVFAISSALALDDGYRAFVKQLVTSIRSADQRDRLLRRRADLAGQREVDVIHRQAVHLAGLLDDLLDVARVAAGKVTLAKRRVALHDVIAQAVEMGSPLLEKKRHELRVDVPSDIAIVADPQRITQVFANLVTNAAKYTDAGGHISVRTTREADRIVTRVTDDGIGIRPDQHARLFEAFFQVSRAEGRSEGGLGLGLALVKSLVELHGGEVAIENNGAARGTTFVVKLPAPAEAGVAGENDARSTPSSNPPARAVRAAPPRRVLLVDDNEDLAELAAEVLRQAGHVVEVAHDGPSALTLATRFQPEVAVLDIGLPVMDGYALACELRAAMGDVAPRMIAVSGYGQAVDRELSKRAGFVEHLVKPVDFGELEGVIGER